MQDGATLAEFPVSPLLIHAYAGFPAMLAVWLVRAAAEREDERLGLPRRNEALLVQASGLTPEIFAQATEILIRDRFLTRDPHNGRIRVPWGLIYFSSLRWANEVRAYVKALRENAVGSAPVIAQESLALGSTE
jgi:hypothetical protein